MEVYIVIVMHIPTMQRSISIRQPVLSSDISCIHSLVLHYTQCIWTFVHGCALNVGGVILIVYIKIFIQTNWILHAVSHPAETLKTYTLKAGFFLATEDFYTVVSVLLLEQEWVLLPYWSWCVRCMHFIHGTFKNFHQQHWLKGPICNFFICINCFVLSMGEQIVT